MIPKCWPATETQAVGRSYDTVLYSLNKQRWRVFIAVILHNLLFKKGYLVYLKLVYLENNSKGLWTGKDISINTVLYVIY